MQNNAEIAAPPLEQNATRYANYACIRKVIRAFAKIRVPVLALACSVRVSTLIGTTSTCVQNVQEI